MIEPSLRSFENPDRHAAVSEIIRRRSANPADVRDAVLGGLDLAQVRTVLDLGCGFGFMSEAVARRVAPDAQITGVDACAANERPFLERIALTGRAARFVCRRVGSRLDWPEGSFDLVVASYALYFFPEALPEVARVLSPQGLFVAVTHSERSCRDLARVVGLPPSDARALAAIRGFSAENGADLLARWFAELERIDYRNALAFDAADEEEFLTYMRFKLPFLLPEAAWDGELAERLLRAARASLAGQGRLIINKDDAAFRCRSPRRP